MDVHLKGAIPHNNFLRVVLDPSVLGKAVKMSVLGKAVKIDDRGEAFVGGIGES